MIWILDPYATWLWLLANAGIGACYCTVLSHMLPHVTGVSPSMALRMKAFIYSCGCGHIAMIGFMAILMHEVWAWRVVVMWDIFTCYVSAEFAVMVWRAYSRMHTPEQERDNAHERATAPGD